MLLKNIKEILKLTILTSENMDLDIKKGYVCDLLSEVMGKAESESIWITVHTNMNVIAVAAMLDIKAVIITEGHTPNEKFIEKALEEKIAIFTTESNSFEITGKLYELGVRG